MSEGMDKPYKNSLGCNTCHIGLQPKSMLNILRDYPSTAACAAAKRAIGTRKGEQLT